MGGGLSIYLNATKGTAKYQATDLWVQNTPSDTESVGLSYNRGGFNIGYFDKRVGGMWNDNGANHQAIAIDPYHLQNLFFNYSLPRGSRFGDSRIRLAVNNIFDHHSITAVSAASTASNLPAANDVLTLMSGRSVSLSVTFGLSAR